MLKVRQCNVAFVQVTLFCHTKRGSEEEHREYGTLKCIGVCKVVNGLKYVHLSLVLSEMHMECEAKLLNTQTGTMPRLIVSQRLGVGGGRFVSTDGVK